MRILYPASFILRLLLLSSFLFPVSSLIPAANGATFNVPFAADTASTNTVKLILHGYLFSDTSPQAYTMTWNSGDQLYYAACDDAAFVNGYYRIEDGSGNIVVEEFSINSSEIAGTQVEDVFVRNDGDDVKRGNLYVRPESATTNIDLRIDNSGSTIVLAATDTASGSTSGKVLQLQAASIDLQTSTAADIAVTGVGQSATANSAVTRSNIDTLKGSGWSYDSGNNTIMGLRADVDDLLGTGTFASGDSLFLTGTGQGYGIRVQWAFDPADVNDSISFVQVYYGGTAIPGYAQSGSSALSSATLSAIRGSMSPIYPPRGSFSVNIPVLENYYIIVVAFDHTSPSPQAWGSNQILVTGVPTVIDPTTPISGSATSYGGAIAANSNAIYAIQSEFGSGGAVKVLFADQNSAQASSVTLSDYYNTLTALSSNIAVVFRKSSTFDALRLTGKARHSAAAKICQPYLVCDALSASTSVEATTATEFVVELDCSSLADGTYVAYMKISDTSNSTSDTAYVYYPIIEAYNK